MRILLRNAWQNVNIGDIGHYLGALELIQRGLPDAEVILWPRPGALADGVRELVLESFPDLEIIEGGLENGQPDTMALAAAWEKADFMLHGSGSGFSSRRDLAAWHRATGKPYGVFGTSTDPVSGFGDGRDPEGGTLAHIRRCIEGFSSDHLDGETREIIDGASFMFCRDTLSLDYLKGQQVRTPILEFGPDSQFGMRKKDDVLGDAFCEERGLEAGKFICVIPRLRYTPYHRMRNKVPNDVDRAKDAINDRTTALDLSKLQDMMTAYVRNTGNQVLACPEMTYQVALAKEALVAPLPEDVKKHVVLQETFWRTYEAASVYARAQAVVSMDCHSPIIALAQGVPGIYVRQPTDTCKGQMYHDIGAGDWIFEVDEIEGQDLWLALEKIHNNFAEAQRRVRTVMDGVDALQRRMVKVLGTAAVS